MTSTAKTVDEYLAALPADRRAAVSAVRDTVRKNMPAGIAETMQYGMVAYVVPQSVYPAGYHCDPSKPLPFACLASQKSYISLYLMSVYANPEIEKWFRKAYIATGKKLDMGKSCVRFKKIDDLPLKVIGEAVGKLSVKEYVALCEKASKR